MTRFYVNSDGDYIGGFDGANQPSEAIEISAPPMHALDKFINGKWQQHTNTASEMPSLQEQIDALFAGGKVASDMKAKIDAIREKFKP